MAAVFQVEASQKKHLGKHFGGQDKNNNTLQALEWEAEGLSSARVLHDPNRFLILHSQHRPQSSPSQPSVH